MSELTQVIVQNNDEGEVILVNTDLELHIVKRDSTYFIDVHKQFHPKDGEDPEDHDYDDDYVDSLNIDVD